MFSVRLPGYRADMLASKVRDTVQGVVSASRHLLWYLDCQTGGAGPRATAARVRRSAVRAPPDPPVATAARVGGPLPWTA